jgi:four helix bundle protein
LIGDFILAFLTGTALAPSQVMPNSKAEEMKARTKRFALDVLSFRRMLPATDEAADVGRQLSRAATGVGANYRAACRSRSDAEFAARIGVVLEEADGLTALHLLDEANQLTAILAASSITARRKLKSI